MSNNTRLRNGAPGSTENPTRLYEMVEQEMAEGYLEVEKTGITLARVVCAYGVMLRSAWSHTIGSVRSLVRVTPAH
jgi:hypothetical protein